MSRATNGAVPSFWKLITQDRRSRRGPPRKSWLRYRLNAARARICAVGAAAPTRPGSVGAVTTLKLRLASDRFHRARPLARVERLERQSHHGWGKGAVAGAVVGILFPPSLLGGAVAGGLGGGLVARMNRSLDRGDIKDLGEVMDAGEIALVVVAHTDSTDAVKSAISHATKSVTKESASADEVREELNKSTATST